MNSGPSSIYDLLPRLTNSLNDIEKDLQLNKNVYKSKIMKYIIHGAKLTHSKRIAMYYLGKIYNQQCSSQL